ncbi:MAG: CPBP family intramembrane metalloprotease [Candidatus Nomurabacteria bacterium]|nr:MAG: CPBP family intramembrane metalloprotease [Candidatus Nomurabacteria bacterium]
MAYLLPWLVWGTSVAQQNKLLTWHIPQSLAFWFGLTIATYGVAALSGGKVAVIDLLKRLVRFRVKPVWYVISLVVVPIISIVALLIYYLFGGENKHFATDITTSSLLLVFLIEWWLFLITEETAWRGFALPRLQKKFTPLNASLILGLLWGLWHIPLFMIADSFQANLPFVGFLISAIATSILTSWVFNNSRGSVLLVAIFHAVTDVSIAYTGVMSGDKTLFWLFVLIQVVVALSVIRTSAFNKSVMKDRELTYRSAA